MLWPTKGHRPPSRGQRTGAAEFGRKDMEGRYVHGNWEVCGSPRWKWSLRNRYLGLGFRRQVKTNIEIWDQQETNEENITKKLIESRWNFLRDGM